MSIWALVLIAFVTTQSQQPESKPVPKDSFEIMTAGCLKGRVFTATGPREEGSPVRGPDITGRSFRLAGKRELMDQVKEHNGHYVEITGLVLKSAVTSTTPGTRIGNTRVVIGAPPPSSDPAGMSMRSPSGGLPVMDASALRYIDASCPITQK